MSLDTHIDIDEPPWNKSTYCDRWKYFAYLTDFRTLFASTEELKEAEQLCDDYKLGKAPPETKASDIIRAKQLRDSAYHPETGELMQPIARLSSLMPVSVLLNTTIHAFQKSTVGLLLSQTLGQIHSAIINYTYENRANDDDDKARLKETFVCAILASTVVTVGCKKMASGKRSTFAKTMPFCAIAAGHITNLPIIRYKDITTGLPLFLKDPEHPFMKSQVAAVKGLTECIITRILMCVPCLLVLPIMQEKIMPFCFSQRRPMLSLTLQTFLCAICCMLTIPSALALFPRINTIRPEWLKICPEEYEEFKRHTAENVDKIYYNKGL